MSPITDFRAVTFRELLDGQELSRWKMQYQRADSEEWHDVQAVDLVKENSVADAVPQSDSA